MPQKKKTPLMDTGEDISPLRRRSASMGVAMSLARKEELKKQTKIGRPLFAEEHYDAVEIERRKKEMMEGEVSRARNEAEDAVKHARAMAAQKDEAAEELVRREEEMEAMAQDVGKRARDAANRIRAYESQNVYLQTEVHKNKERENDLVKQIQSLEKRVNECREETVWVSKNASVTLKEAQDRQEEIKHEVARRIEEERKAANLLELNPRQESFMTGFAAEMGNTIVKGLQNRIVELHEVLDAHRQQIKELQVFKADQLVIPPPVVVPKKPPSVVLGDALSSSRASSPESIDSPPPESFVDEEDADFLLQAPEDAYFRSLKHKSPAYLRVAATLESVVVGALASAAVTAIYLQLIRQGWTIAPETLRVCLRIGDVEEMTTVRLVDRQTDTATYEADILLPASRMNSSSPSPQRSLPQHHQLMKPPSYFERGGAGGSGGCSVSRGSPGASPRSRCSSPPYNPRSMTSDGSAGRTRTHYDAAGYALAPGEEIVVESRGGSTSDPPAGGGSVDDLRQATSPQILTARYHDPAHALRHGATQTSDPRGCVPGHQHQHQQTSVASPLSGGSTATVGGVDAAQALRVPPPPTAAPETPHPRSPRVGKGRGRGAPKSPKLTLEERKRNHTKRLQTYETEAKRKASARARGETEQKRLVEEAQRRMEAQEIIRKKLTPQITATYEERKKSGKTPTKQATTPRTGYVGGKPGAHNSTAVTRTSRPLRTDTFLDRAFDEGMVRNVQELLPHLQLREQITFSDSGSDVAGGQASSAGGGVVMGVAPPLSKHRVAPPSADQTSALSTMALQQLHQHADGAETPALHTPRSAVSAGQRAVLLETARERSSARGSRRSMDTGTGQTDATLAGPTGDGEGGSSRTERDRERARGTPSSDGGATPQRDASVGPSDTPAVLTVAEKLQRYAMAVARGTGSEALLLLGTDSISRVGGGASTRGGSVPPVPADNVSTQTQKETPGRMFALHHASHGTQTAEVAAPKGASTQTSAPPSPSGGARQRLSLSGASARAPSPTETHRTANSPVSSRGRKRAPLFIETFSPLSSAKSPGRRGVVPPSRLLKPTSASPRSRSPSSYLGSPRPGAGVGQRRSLVPGASSSPREQAVQRRNKSYDFSSSLGSPFSPAKQLPRVPSRKKSRREEDVEGSRSGGHALSPRASMRSTRARSARDLTSQGGTEADATNTSVASVPMSLQLGSPARGASFVGGSQSQFADSVVDVLSAAASFRAGSLRGEDLTRSDTGLKSTSTPGLFVPSEGSRRGKAEMSRDILQASILSASDRFPRTNSHASVDGVGVWSAGHSPTGSPGPGGASRASRDSRTSNGEMRRPSAFEDKSPSDSPVHVFEGSLRAPEDGREANIDDLTGSFKEILQQADFRQVKRPSAMFARTLPTSGKLSQSPSAPSPPPVGGLLGGLESFTFGERYDADDRAGHPDGMPHSSLPGRAPSAHHLLGTTGFVIPRNITASPQQSDSASGLLRSPQSVPTVNSPFNATVPQVGFDTDSVPRGASFLMPPPQGQEPSRSPSFVVGPGGDMRNGSFVVQGSDGHGGVTIPQSSQPSTPQVQDASPLGSRGMPPRPESSARMRYEKDTRQFLSDGRQSDVSMLGSLPSASGTMSPAFSMGRRSVTDLGSMIRMPPTVDPDYIDNPFGSAQQSEIGTPGTRKNENVSFSTESLPTSHTGMSGSVTGHPIITVSGVAQGGDASGSFVSLGPQQTQHMPSTLLMPQQQQQLHLGAQPQIQVVSPTPSPSQSSPLLDHNMLLQQMQLAQESYGSFRTVGSSSPALSPVQSLSAHQFAQQLPAHQQQQQQQRMQAPQDDPIPMAQPQRPTASSPPHGPPQEVDALLSTVGHESSVETTMDMQLPPPQPVRLPSPPPEPVHTPAHSVSPSIAEPQAPAPSPAAAASVSGATSPTRQGEEAPCAGAGGAESVETDGGAEVREAATQGAGADTQPHPPGVSPGSHSPMSAGDVATPSHAPAEVAVEPPPPSQPSEAAPPAAPESATTRDVPETTESSHAGSPPAAAPQADPAPQASPPTPPADVEEAGPPPAAAQSEAASVSAASEPPVSPTPSPPPTSASPPREEPTKQVVQAAPTATVPDAAEHLTEGTDTVKSEEHPNDDDEGHAEEDDSDSDSDLSSSDMRGGFGALNRALGKDVSQITEEELLDVMMADHPEMREHFDKLPEGEKTKVKQQLRQTLLMQQQASQFGGDVDDSQVAQSPAVKAVDVFQRRKSRVPPPMMPSSD